MRRINSQTSLCSPFQSPTGAPRGTTWSHRERGGGSPEWYLQPRLLGTEWGGEKGKQSQEEQIKMTWAGSWAAWGSDVLELPSANFISLSSLQNGHSSKRNQRLYGSSMNLLHSTLCLGHHRSSLNTYEMSTDTIIWGLCWEEDTG